MAAALAPGLLALPAVWHGALRTFLTWQASRSGYRLIAGRISGGIFGDTTLEGVRLLQNESGTSDAGPGTDLSIEGVRFSVVWSLPGSKRPASWLQEVRLEGVRGRLNLTSRSSTGVIALPAKGGAACWLPVNFSIRGDNFELRNGPRSVRFAGFYLTGKDGAPGAVDVREVHAAGPGFAGTVGDLHGQTFWKGNHLALTGMTLGERVTPLAGTLDFSQLGRQRLEWDCRTNAFGGEIRGEGTIDFSREGTALEIAMTLHRIALAPFARALGIAGPVDGKVEQASFTFRGDPDNFPAAQMWLSAQATDFHCGDRRWQSVDTQAVVVDRRVQVNRFDLRQDGNRLSLSGECPLPSDDFARLVWTGGGSWWRAAGFSCSVDARLEDLHSLAALAGPGVPELTGRMSINGQLSAAPARAEITGYLNVEGTWLNVCGAPLDFLRSTLLFRGGALEVADLQAAHDTDYFTAHGVIGLSGEDPARRGVIRAEVRDMSVYTPALTGLPCIGERAAGVRRLDAILRMENGDLLFDQWDGEQAGYLLAR